VEIGVRIPHTGASATPELVREWCTLADEAGFGALWGVDHIVLPEHVVSEYVLARRPANIVDGALSAQLAPNFELATTLAFVAAITERIKIGTAVTVLPIRNAVLNARQLATIDRYSGGRLMCGVGVGWLKEEADVMHMPWDRRGARAEEHIALLRAIWTAPGPYVDFQGEFWTVPPMDSEPRPVQQPIPILIGGHSEVAIDRAARLGDGWIAAGVSPQRLSELMAPLHIACERHGRDPSTLPIYCRGGQGALTIDELRRFEELEVRSLQVNIDTLDELKRFADEVLPQLC
jgi:probable F420-dependent oxidoreductase